MEWRGPALVTGITCCSPIVEAYPVQLNKWHSVNSVSKVKCRPSFKTDSLSVLSTAALKISRDGPASADEFVPSLIFLIIYTSPQTLYSNINYISRFSHPMRIMSGEVGYYFTNLVWGTGSMSVWGMGYGEWEYE